MEVFDMFLGRLCGRHHVNVMETEIGIAETLEKIKCGLKLGFCRRLIIVSGVPWAIKRPPSKNIKSIPTEIMPIANRKAEMLGHGLAHQLFIRIVIFKGQWILAVLAFIFYWVDMIEITAHGLVL